ncbi:MAG: asparaginase, partial [Candidatus Limnocylindrales bacterium]
VLVRQIRNGIVESVHRGDVVEVDVNGRLIRAIGNPERVVSLRSCVKPFGLLALIEAGGIDAFDLSPSEIAIMASSHSGEDIHVRTLQAVYRRANVSQTVLACGNEGMPLDALTAARLARDGERAGPIRHMCSGQHSSMILLARLKDWPLEGYWKPEHPSQEAYRAAVAGVFRTAPDRLVRAIDGCGIETYAFALSEVARAYAFLADPASVPVGDPRARLSPAMIVIRDAMLAHPEMVAGSRERIDTSVMKALPGRLISKGGMEALRGLAILGSDRRPSSGLALKIEDGDGYERATWAATVESLRQAGVLEAKSLRELARYQRPASLDPHGRVAAEAIAEFELAPVGELIG